MLREMISQNGIPAQALAHAYEMYDGPIGDEPGCLVKRLMWRFEDKLGAGDAIKDATTSAKLDGNISDHAWEKYIRPLFEIVRECLKFRHRLTESAKEANARLEKMVPHTQVIRSLFIHHV